MLNNMQLHASFIVDSAGCGYYRQKFVNDTLSCFYHSRYRFLESESPIRDETFLKYAKSIRLQRLYSNVYIPYFTWLKELSEKCGFRIILDYDDILCYDDIPAWNNCKFDTKGCDANIKFYMDNADLITVSTQQLMNYYSLKFSIPRNKFRVIPNYLPHWVSGYNFDEYFIEKRYNISKKRIVFCCSTSHFDELNQNNGIDDFSDIISWIRDNADKYDFCFQGGFPKKLQDIKEKFQVYKGEPILNYFHARSKINATLYIQPLQDCLFNNAKSNIKQLEAWAEGVPILTSRLAPYTNDSDMCFSNVSELDSKVNMLLSDYETYKNSVVEHYSRMNMYWLENNIKKWEVLLNG